MGGRGWREDEVESEEGEGNEKEVRPPSPSHAVHGLIWVSPMQGTLLQIKATAVCIQFKKCNGALISH